MRKLALSSLGLTAVLFAAAMPGCVSTEPQRVRPTAPPPPPPAATVAAPRRATPVPDASLDPCAMRLHDLAGALFLYYFTNQRMPGALEELNTFPGAEAEIPLVCPESNQPYVYSVDGILLPKQKSRVVVYDATPAHYGNTRWAIIVSDPADDQPMIAKVISLPESFFLFRPGRPATPALPDEATSTP